MRHYYRLILRKLPYIKTEPTRTNTLQLLERAEEQSKKTPNAIAIEFRSRFAANTLPVFEDDPYLWMFWIVNFIFIEILYRMKKWGISWIGKVQNSKILAIVFESQAIWSRSELIWRKTRFNKFFNLSVKIVQSDSFKRFFVDFWFERIYGSSTSKCLRKALHDFANVLDWKWTKCFELCQ